MFYVRHYGRWQSRKCFFFRSIYTISITLENYCLNLLLVLTVPIGVNWGKKNYLLNLNLLEIPTGI